MPRFTRAQVDHARQRLAQPDPALSPSHRELVQRIARHVLEADARDRETRVVRFIPREVIHLRPIDGGRE